MVEKVIDSVSKTFREVSEEYCKLAHPNMTGEDYDLAVKDVGPNVMWTLSYRPSDHPDSDSTKSMKEMQVRIKDAVRLLSGLQVRVYDKKEFLCTLTGKIVWSYVSGFAIPYFGSKMMRDGKEVNKWLSIISVIAMLDPTVPINYRYDPKCELVEA